MGNNSIDGNTNGFKITLGFGLQIVVTILSIGIAWASMKGELAAALAQSAENAATIRSLEAELINARLDLRAVDAKVDMLMQDYKRDANKYIRDPKDRR